jgi:hypothetical protein
MVTHHKVNGHLQPSDLFAERRICICVAPMGHVAGDNHEFCITMFAIDAVHCKAQAPSRVCTKQQPVSANHVGIGQLNEFHNNCP